MRRAAAWARVSRLPLTLRAPEERRKCGAIARDPRAPLLTLGADGGAMRGWDGGPTRCPAPGPTSETRRAAPSPLAVQHPLH